MKLDAVGSSTTNNRIVRRKDQDKRKQSDEKKRGRKTREARRKNKRERITEKE